MVSISIENFGVFVSNMFHWTLISGFGKVASSILLLYFLRCIFWIYDFWFRIVKFQVLLALQQLECWVALVSLLGLLRWLSCACPMGRDMTIVVVSDLWFKLIVIPYCYLWLLSIVTGCYFRDEHVALLHVGFDSKGCFGIFFWWIYQNTIRVSAVESLLLLLSLLLWWWILQVYGVTK